MLKLEAVETCTTEPSATRPGYCTLKPRPVAEIIREVNAHLAPLFDESSFTDITAWEVKPGDPAPLWPERYRWIACYAVTGNSEGHYIHIDVVSDGNNGQGRRIAHIGQCKTFGGWAHACEIANAAGRILQA